MRPWALLTVFALVTKPEFASFSGFKSYTDYQVWGFFRFFLACLLGPNIILPTGIKTHRLEWTVVSCREEHCVSTPVLQNHCHSSCLVELCILEFTASEASSSPYTVCISTVSFMSVCQRSIPSNNTICWGWEKLSLVCLYYLWYLSFLTCKIWRRNGDKHFPAKSFGVTLGVFFCNFCGSTWCLKTSGHVNLPVLPVLKCHLHCAERTWVPHLFQCSANSYVPATSVLNSRQFSNCCLQNWATKCKMTISQIIILNCSQMQIPITAPSWGLKCLSRLHCTYHFIH